jgi:hypothetical protein
VCHCWPRFFSVLSRVASPSAKIRSSRGRLACLFYCNVNELYVLNGLDYSSICYYPSLSQVEIRTWNFALGGTGLCLSCENKIPKYNAGHLVRDSPKNPIQRIQIQTNPIQRIQSNASSSYSRPNNFGGVPLSRFSQACIFCDSFSANPSRSFASH